MAAASPKPLRGLVASVLAVAALLVGTRPRNFKLQKSTRVEQRPYLRLGGGSSKIVRLESSDGTRAQLPLDPVLDVYGRARARVCVYTHIHAGCVYMQCVYARVCLRAAREGAFVMHVCLLCVLTVCAYCVLTVCAYCVLTVCAYCVCLLCVHTVRVCV